MGRRTLVLIVALLLAAVAAFALWQFMSNVQKEAEAKLEYRTVYRSIDLIAEGTEGSLVLSQERAVQDREETQFMPDNAIGSDEELRQVLTGRVAAGPISGHQILTTDQWVALTAEIKPLAERIPEGRQAITISVDSVRGLNGFIEPGDRINVIVTLQSAISDFVQQSADSGIPLTSEELAAIEEQVNAGLITRFVMQGVPVLAVGNEIRPEKDIDKNVTVTTVAGEGEQAADQARGLLTLEVTPEEAERLVFTFENGSVWLTLVPADFVPVPTEGVTRETLFEEPSVGR
ncbi:MAG: Flp pilus assembly protein CpaB [Gammaproteobacteria bacterium]|nr:Flp pilus assembly protein CpaB [Gammaproteobacteria bacterium]